MKNNPTALLLLTVLLLACMVLPVSGEASNGMAGLDAFAEAYLATLRVMAPELTCELLEDTYSISVSDADGHEVVLSTLNAYTEYLKSGEEMQRIIDHYVSASLGVLQSDSPPVAQGSLFPVVKPLSYLDMLMANGVTPVYDPFLDGLVVLYVLDTPTAVRPIDESELATLDVDRDALFDVAMENLTSYLPPVDVEFLDSIGILWADGMYDASLLLGDFASLYDFDMKGEIIVALPDRSPLYFVDSEDAAGMEILAGFAPAAYAEAAYPVTGRLLRWTGEGFEWYE